METLAAIGTVVAFVLAGSPEPSQVTGVIVDQGIVLDVSAEPVYRVRAVVNGVVSDFAVLDHDLVAVDVNHVEVVSDTP